MMARTIIPTRTMMAPFLNGIPERPMPDKNKEFSPENNMQFYPEVVNQKDWIVNPGLTYRH
jgi:hypothetical protein